MSPYTFTPYFTLWVSSWVVSSLSRVLMSDPSASGIPGTSGSSYTNTVGSWAPPATGVAPTSTTHDTMQGASAGNADGSPISGRNLRSPLSAASCGRNAAVTNSSFAVDSVADSAAILLQLRALRGSAVPTMVRTTASALLDRGLQLEDVISLLDVTRLIGNQLDSKREPFAL